MVFEKGTCAPLGAQIVGYEGVDKRIDVLAAAIHAGMRATQLKNLDLAYAPPYSSAKDPVNIAGFMIDNIANGTMKQWYLRTLTIFQGMEVRSCWMSGPRTNTLGAIWKDSVIFRWMTCGTGWMR